MKVGFVHIAKVRHFLKARVDLFQSVLGRSRVLRVQKMLDNLRSFLLDQRVQSSQEYFQTSKVKKLEDSLRILRNALANDTNKCCELVRNATLRLRIHLLYDRIQLLHRGALHYVTRVQFHAFLLLTNVLEKRGDPLYLFSVR